MRYLFLLLAILGVLSTGLIAQVSLTSAAANHMQDFNTLPTSGSGNTWTDNSTLTGWYAARTGTVAINAGNGGSNAGAIYSFGTGTATERALGSVASGSTGTITCGIRILNADASAGITSIQVAFTGEQWRCGGNATPHVLAASYQVGATSLTAGTWTAASTLDFTGPIAVTTAGALDGNLIANQVAVSDSIAVNVAPGQEIWLRWSDPDNTGSDHGLALDDLSITATFAGGGSPSMSATPGTLNISSVSGTAGTPDSYTLAGSNLTGNVTVTAPANCEVSITGATGTYADTQPVAPTGGNINQVVHVRIKASAAVGTWGRTLTNIGGGATQQDVTINGTVTSAPTAPVITSIYPPFGNANGSATITITGTDLAGTTSITFGGVTATNISAGATQVTCTLPAGAGAGQVNVALTTAGGTDTVTNGFTYMVSRLAVGDIWVLGYHADTDDSFAIVTWVSLNANEIIGLTDKSFDGSNFFTNENHVLWQVPSSGLPAGSVITFADNAGTPIVSDGTLLSAVISGLSNDGDQLFVFQGDLSNGDLVFGANFASALATPGWLTSGTATNSDSYLPSSLNVAGGNLDISASDTSDNGQYTGARTGLTISGFQALIANFANWTFSNSAIGALDATDFTITTPNLAPTITLPGGAVNYTENDAATVLDAAATCTDGDSADFDTGTLTVDFQAGGTADDRLEIRNQGTAAGQIGVSGSNVSFGGTTIGTFTGGTGVTALAITFNASSSPAACQALLRNLTFRNVSDAPATAARTVRFVATDGDGGTSTAITTTVNFTDANDAPVLTLPGAQTVAVSGTLTFNTAGGNAISMSDVDAGLAVVRVNITATSGALSATGSATVTGNGTTSLQIDGNLTNVNATLQNLVFTAPGTGVAVTLGVTGSDLGATGAGGTQTDTGNITVNVTATPAINVPGGTVTFTAAIAGNSPQQSYAVTGVNLGGNITITATAPFEVSITSGTGFSSGATLPAAGGTLFVRYSPTSGVSHSGTITHAAAGVTPSPTRALDGTVFAVTTAALSDASVGTPYGQSLTVVGGVAPLTWAITSGPAWLIIDQSGQLSGVPASGDAGNVNVTVTVTDNQSPTQTATRTFGLTVDGGGGGGGGSGGDGGGGGGCSASDGQFPGLILLAALTTLFAGTARRRRQ